MEKKSSDLYASDNSNNSSSLGRSGSGPDTNTNEEALLISSRILHLGRSQHSSQKSSPWMLRHCYCTPTILLVAFLPVKWEAKEYPITCYYRFRGLSCSLCEWVNNFLFRCITNAVYFVYSMYSCGSLHCITWIFLTISEIYASYIVSISNSNSPSVLCVTW